MGINFPDDKIKNIENGLLRLFNYYNGLKNEAVKVIHFANDIAILLKFYIDEIQYRTEFNKSFLLHITYYIDNFEYLINKDIVWRLEGTKDEPKDYQNYHNEYLKAYQKSIEVIDFFEKTEPELFTELPELFNYEGYNYSSEQIFTKPAYYEKVNKAHLVRGLFEMLTTMGASHDRTTIAKLAFFLINGKKAANKKEYQTLLNAISAENKQPTNKTAKAEKETIKSYLQTLNLLKEKK